MSKFIIISHTILEHFNWLMISTHLCLHISQNVQLLFTISSLQKDPDPKFLICNVRIRIRS